MSSDVKLATMSINGVSSFRFLSACFMQQLESLWILKMVSPDRVDFSGPHIFLNYSSTDLRALLEGDENLETELNFKRGSFGYTIDNWGESSKDIGEFRRPINSAMVKKWKSNKHTSICFYGETGQIDGNSVNGRLSGEELHRHGVYRFEVVFTLLDNDILKLQSKKVLFSGESDVNYNRQF